MEKYIISGIQQIGIGVTDLVTAWKYYIELFNMDVKILDDNNVADIMAPYMGGKPRQKRAVIAINMQGGGGFEIWNHQQHKPKKADFELQFGDLGCFAAKIKSRDVKQSFEEFSKKNVKVLGSLSKSIDGKETFFIEDIYGNTFQIVEDKYLFRDEQRSTGGPVGAIVGCSDIDKTLVLYRDILGYDKVLADETGVFNDLAGLPSGDKKYRRVLLTESKPRKGGFSHLFGQSYVELVQALDRTPRKIYEGRYWGDPGFIQICFDVRNMRALEKKCESLGFPFTADSAVKQKSDAESFEMGDAAGHFTYIEDPDGYLIEFVETHKIPIMKKLGLYLNLRKRDVEKPLPDWILKMLRFMRMKPEDVK
ncbi:VOC family protein [Paludibacter sp. 221]|uniref:VOC family protein n=1 Tax=Paludibacter sp. 221 TaxID=2302939 RepID=UPI0013CFE9F7|nr:VOC family protein [Paludibacter sp. 221]NDV46904.1 VOC family protein [Paludibacter sp. 221]